jgi:Skp family chaperone for outer membrane proteins
MISGRARLEISQPPAGLPLGPTYLAVMGSDTAQDAPQPSPADAGAADSGGGGGGPAPADAGGAVKLLQERCWQLIDACGGLQHFATGVAVAAAVVLLGRWLLHAQTRRALAAHEEKNALKRARTEEYRAQEIAKMREARLKREAEQATLRAARDEQLAAEKKARAELKAATDAKAREEALKRKEALGKHVEAAIAAAAADPQPVAEGGAAGSASSPSSSSCSPTGKKKSSAKIHVKPVGKFPAMHVVVHWTGKERRDSVDVDPTETVGSLKRKLSTLQAFDLPAVSSQRLVFAGRVLGHDTQTLRAAGVAGAPQNGFISLGPG